MNKKERRLNEMLGLLTEQPTLSISDLAELLKVSEMTIRRDLKILKNSDSFNSVRNAALRYKVSDELDEYGKIKDRIGKYAASLIAPEDILIIDSGTTTCRMSKYIPENMGLSILCYDFDILSQLMYKKDISLLFPGGHYDARGEHFESCEAAEFICQHRASKLFLSASGIHDTLGITCAHSQDVPVKQTSIASSQTKILLADSSKFGKIHTAYFTSLSEIDVLVTDSGISKDWIGLLEETGIQLHIV